MPKGNNAKHKEHYIPQFYLKYFASDINKKYIWQYDSVGCNSKEVPIDSICYEENLYELTDNGKVVYRNFLENKLAVLEGRIAQTISRIREKANKILSQNDNFLTEEEQLWLIIFVSIQILRDPDIQTIAANLVSEISKSNISEEKKRNYALLHTLEIFKELSPDEVTALASKIKHLKKQLRKVFCVLEVFLLDF